MSGDKFATSLTLGLMFACEIACLRQSKLITKEQAISIAKKELDRRGIEGKKFDEVESTPEGWRVSFVSVPSVPGGHSTIYLSRSGKILEYRGGR